MSSFAISARPSAIFLVLLYLRQTAAPAQAITSGMPAANIAAFLIGAVYMLFLTRNVVGWVKPTLELKALFSYSIPVSFNLVASLVIVSTDLFLIGVFSTAKVVGLYRACVQLVISVRLDLNGVIFRDGAGLFRLCSRPSSTGALRDFLYGRKSPWSPCWRCRCSFLLLFNGRDILGMFGPEFHRGGGRIVDPRLRATGAGLLRQCGGHPDDGTQAKAGSGKQRDRGAFQCRC